MAECSECGKQTMSFTCHYCGEKFCSEHRLPENHDCDGLETGKKKEYMNNSETEKSEAEERKSVSSSSTSADTSQKWFKDKDLKQENKATRGVRTRSSLFSDIKYTLTHNYTLSIILITSALFFIGEVVPLIKYGMMLFPNIEPASAIGVSTTLHQNALNILGYAPTLLNQPWGLLTVMLAHGNLIHLFANMVTLYFFGSALEKSIGSKKFLKFYIGTGLLASIAYVITSNLIYLIHGTGVASILTPAVGASGAVVAAVGAVAMLYPQAEVLLYFVFPMKIQTAVKFFGALETINLIAKLGGITLPVIGGFASSAHLAGLLAGVLIGKKLREKHGGRARVNVFQ